MNKGCGKTFKKNCMGIEMPFTCGKINTGDNILPEILLCDKCKEDQDE